MRPALILGVLIMAALAGCGASTGAMRWDARHPADPRAPAAPPAASAFRLQPDEFDRAVTASVPGSAADSSTAPEAPKPHPEPPMHHHDPGTGGMSPALPKTHSPGSTTARSRERPVYSCPMHPEVTDTTASKCPKCGMTLERREDHP